MIFDGLLRSMAYLLAGVFLQTVYPEETVPFIFNFIGWIFIAFSFFQMFVIIVNRGNRIANNIHRDLVLILFIVSMARLDILLIGTHNVLYIILAIIFSILLLVGLIFDVVRNMNMDRIRQGTRPTVIRYLRIFSVVLSMFALAQIISNVNYYGGPIFYVALGLMCLGISFLL